MKILVALLSILIRVYHVYCQSAMNVSQGQTPELLWTHTHCFHWHKSIYIIQLSGWQNGGNFLNYISSSLRSHTKEKNIPFIQLKYYIIFWIYTNIYYLIFITLFSVFMTQTILLGSDLVHLKFYHGVRKWPLCKYFYNAWHWLLVIAKTCYIIYSTSLQSIVLDLPYSCLYLYITMGCHA